MLIADWWHAQRDADDHLVYLQLKDYGPATSRRIAAELGLGQRRTVRSLRRLKAANKADRQTVHTANGDRVGVWQAICGFTPDSIRCPDCGFVSYHPKDILHEYCGNCHKFHDQMARS